MGRRFPNTPPPRPSAGRSTSGSSTPPPTPTTPRGGYSDRGLPTNNQITFSSNRPEPTKAARQARMVGDLARSQQADAQQIDQPTEGEPNSSQDSVLDAADMKQRLPSGSMYDEAPEDADGPADDYKQKNERFKEELDLKNRRGRQFNSAASNSDGMTESSNKESPANGSSPKNPSRSPVSPAEESRRSAQLLKRQQGDSKSLLQNKLAASNPALDKLQNVSVPGLGVSGSQLMDTGSRISDLISAGSGVGLLWSVPKANITAANRYINSRILYFGYRSPKERAANPGTKYLDMLDVVIAIVVDLIATVYLLPVIGTIAAIIIVAAVFVLGAAYLAPLIGELAVQLMN